MWSSYHPPPADKSEVEFFLQFLADSESVVARGVCAILVGFFVVAVVVVLCSCPVQSLEGGCRARASNT